MTRGMVAAVAVIAVTAAGLVLFGVWASSRLTGGFGGTVWIWVAMVGAAVVVAALTAGLIWLAFYSARAGYDDAAAENPHMDASDV